MKHGNPLHRPGKASSPLDDDDSSSSHYSYSSGEEQGRRNGEIYTALRQTNKEKAANALMRMSRPHKTG
jgi:hypothetical protein